MRLARVVVDGRARLAVNVKDGFIVTPYDSLQSLIADGEPGLKVVGDAAARGRPRTDVDVLAPIDHPGETAARGATG